MGIWHSTKAMILNGLVVNRTIEPSFNPLDKPSPGMCLGERLMRKDLMHINLGQMPVKRDGRNVGDGE